MQLCKLFFEDDHGKCTGSGRQVACSWGDGVGRGHPGSGIALRRAHRNTGLQLSALIEERCAFRREHTRCVAGDQDLREHFAQFNLRIPRLGSKPVELLHHGFIVVHLIGVDREHAGCVADAYHFFSGQLVMHVGRQCEHRGHLRHMILVIQHSLIQVGRRPAERYVELKLIREPVRRFFRIGISPGLERRYLAVFTVQCDISVHHGADADCPVCHRCDPVFLLHVAAE